MHFTLDLGLATPPILSAHYPKILQLKTTTIFQSQVDTACVNQSLGLPIEKFAPPRFTAI